MPALNTSEASLLRGCENWGIKLLKNNIASLLGYMVCIMNSYEGKGACPIPIYANKIETS